MSNKKQAVSQPKPKTEKKQEKKSLSIDKLRGLLLLAGTVSCLGLMFFTSSLDVSAQSRCYDNCTDSRQSNTYIRFWRAKQNGYKGHKIYINK